MMGTQKTKLPWEGRRSPASAVVVESPTANELSDLRAALGPHTHGLEPQPGHPTTVLLYSDGKRSWGRMNCACDACLREHQPWLPGSPWPEAREVDGHVFQVSRDGLRAGCQRVPLRVVQAALRESDAQVRRSVRSRRHRTVAVLGGRVAPASGVDGRTRRRERTLLGVYTDGSVGYRGHAVPREELLSVRRALREAGLRDR